MNTSEVLNKAGDLIEERGWGTGVMTWLPDSGAGLCLEGALAAALGIKVGRDFKDPELTPMWTCPAYGAVAEYLELDAAERDKVGCPIAEPLWRWNDADGRTAAEVVEVLRATALIEAARESEQVEQHAAMSAAVVA